MPFARLAVAALLACLPAAAAAQPVGPASREPEPQLRLPRGDGLEIGGVTSVVFIVPAFGGQVSVPVARRASLEVSAEVAPWLLEDGDDFWIATQIQLRVPVRSWARSRRNLVVGVSNL